LEIFLFFDEWQSREAISAHFETSYFQDFARRIPDMIMDEASVKIYPIADIENS